jgi:DNA-binding response OmpR family regulator
LEKKRVVLIGDHWETQMMATCALEGAGYDAIALFDRRHALRAVRDIRPDLVLLDMALPKLKAWQILRSIRQDARIQDVPIIGIVSTDEPAGHTSRRSHGLADVFTSPLDNRLLIRKVRKVLRDDPEPIRS